MHNAIKEKKKKANDSHQIWKALEMLSMTLQINTLKDTSPIERFQALGIYFLFHLLNFWLIVSHMEFNFWGLARRNAIHALPLFTDISFMLTTEYCSDDPFIISPPRFHRDKTPSFIRQKEKEKKRTFEPHKIHTVCCSIGCHILCLSCSYKFLHIKHFYAISNDISIPL